MIDYLSANQGMFWLILGLVLLIVETLVLGLGSGVLLFPALGALVTGSLLWISVLPASWLYGIASFAVSSAVVTAVLWQPLKHLQAGPRLQRDTSSDFIGLRFRLDTAISRETSAQHRYSGITWRVALDNASPMDKLPAGTEVEVIGLDAGILWVVSRQAVAELKSRD